MAKRARDGIQDLIDRTGGPAVKAVVTVDQVYAEFQHEHLNLKHTTGRAKYLEAPLFENYPKWMQQFANELLSPGADAEREWAKVGRRLHDQVPRNAPEEFGDLRRSAALRVTAGARLVQEIPAQQRRLTEEELDWKDEMRGGFDG